MLFYNRSYNYASGTYRKSRVEQLFTEEAQLSTTKSGGMCTFHLYQYDTEEGQHRFIVERTNAWLKSFRRLRNRFDYQIASFEAFLYLTIIIICVRRLVL